MKVKDILELASGSTIITVVDSEDYLAVQDGKNCIEREYQECDVETIALSEYDRFKCIELTINYEQSLLIKQIKNVACRVASWCSAEFIELVANEIRCYQGVLNILFGEDVDEDIAVDINFGTNYIPEYKYKVDESEEW